MLEVSFGFLFFAWIGLSLVWLLTFTQRGRTPWAKRGFRFRRVRWNSAIAATITFFLLGAVAQYLPPSKDLQAGRPVAAITPAPDAAADDAPTVKSAPDADLSQPVTEEQTTLGVTALCAVIFEEVGEAARTGKVEEDKNMAILKLMYVADETLSKELGISDWRAQKIISTSIDRMKNQDPGGNMVSYCLNHNR